MVKQWCLVFVLLVVDTTLGEECGNWEHLHSFREVKWERWSVKDSIFWFVLIKTIARQGESQIPLCKPSDGKLFFRPSTSYNKLFDIVAFRILSNIHDGTPLPKQPMAWRRLLFPPKSSTAAVWLDFKCASDWKDALNICCK